MPRKNKGIFSGGHSVARVREETRVSHRQESLVDVMRRTAIQNACHESPYSTGLFGGQNFGFLRTLYGFFQENIYNGNCDNDYEDYGDGDDNDDEDDEDDEADSETYNPWSHSATQNPLAPHPNLRLLTQEEADEHAKDLAGEEARRKEKLEKNKQKKLRQRERKRLERENQEKLLKEAEQQRSKSTGRLNDNNIIIHDDKSKKETRRKSVDLPPKIENKSIDTRSRADPDEQLKVEEVKTFIDPSTRGQSSSPVTRERKGVAGTTTKKKKTNTTTTPRGRRGPAEREESPVISQTPPLPQDPGADKKENINGPTEECSQRTAYLADEGHRRASCGQYEMAIQYFTNAIKYSPKEYKLFGNRSFCYERLQQYEWALWDAEAALDLEPQWVKGLFRRGKALCGLKRYYEASLTYKNILKQESSSAEALQELKRAQTLHLMEMGFSWEQSCAALKEHASLEEAVEALFGGEAEPGGEASGSAGESVNQLVPPVVEEEDEEKEEEGKWIVLGGRSRTPQGRRENAASAPKTPIAPKSLPRELFTVWVGSLPPAVTIPALYTLFNRAGAVTSVKILVEQQCAFISYSKRDHSDRAIKLLDGLLVEGCPLSVRYPNRFLAEMKNSAPANPQPPRYMKECYFWRTSGCTKPESCTFKHVPEHKHIDRDRLGR